MCILTESSSAHFANITRVDERPSLFQRAEAIKREYKAKLAALIAEYESQLAAALDHSGYDPAYQLGEIAGYVSRLGRIMRRAEELALDRAVACGNKHT